MGLGAWQFRVGAVLAAAFACCLPAGGAAWTLDLADTVRVHTATVRVADVARGPVPADAGAVVVATGGRPGASLEVTGRTVLRRLVMAGLADRVRLGGAERCRIVFLGEPLGAGVLEERIRALLSPHVPAALPEAPPSWLEVDINTGGVHVGEAWDLDWPQPRTLDPGRNLLHVTLRSGERSQRLPVVAVLHAYGLTAVPVASVARGQTPPADGLHWQWTDLAHGSADLVTDPRALEDMVAARDLVPGEVLGRRDLTPRPLVVRGELVDLVVLRGAVAATVRVECRQDGLLGQIVSVRNPLNNRLLAVRVTGPGQVAMGR